MTTEYPTIFIMFGVTGDLTRKKLFLALFHLFSGGYLLDQFKIIGVGRREFSQDDFKKFVRTALQEKKISDSDKFIEHFEYIQGEFDDKETYVNLGKRLKTIDNSDIHVCSNKLFHLSVPPSLVEGIVTMLSESGLTISCSDEAGWIRVLVEKPFGQDVQTAQRLDELLGKFFREEQIFRIDHYLAKETVQNILTFRFSNTIFEPLWNKECIESVEINMFEANTADGRAFYGNTGALRDVGQNHMLQMLALIAMEPCETMNAECIRKYRGRALEKISIGNQLTRGQHDGFVENGESNIETFFSFDAYINNERWKNVPFYLTSGKGLDQSRVEIIVRFKDLTSGEFVPKQDANEESNVLTFTVQPNEGISLLFWAKKAGFEQKVEPRKLSFDYYENDTGRHIDAYEKVIYDCIVGDQTLFTSTAEIIASWNVVEKIMKAWEKLPMISYNVGTPAQDIIRKK